MTRHIFLLSLVSLFACDNAPEPAPMDAFPGVWKFSDNDLDLEVTFRATWSSDRYTFSDINISYPEIPDNTTLTYEMDYIHATEVGFTSLRVLGNSDNFSIVVGMMDLTIRKKDAQWFMDIKALDLIVEGQSTTLVDQTLTRQ